MSFEEVQKVRDEVEAVEAKLIEVENAYLEAQGWTLELDHKKNAIKWRVPASRVPGNYVSSSTMERPAAVANARIDEENDRRSAVGLTEALKAQHDLGNVFVGCGKCAEAVS